MLSITLANPNGTASFDSASDLGYLLYKHPARVWTRSLSFGKVTVFYPQVSDTLTTCTLLPEVDVVALSRQPTRPQSANIQRPLEPYVNDRPYASGSFLAAALREAFGTAMTGQCREKPELAQAALPFVLDLPCVAAPSAQYIRDYFEPLGYRAQIQTLPLDPLYPEWGEAPYHRLHLEVSAPLSQVLRQLYVLLPALDGRKHYFVGEAEIEKLQRYGAGWLDTHPQRGDITRRYLRFKELLDVAQPLQIQDRPANVHDERLDHVAELLRRSGATSVLDLGCGEGKLLGRLLTAPQFRRLLGVDVSARSLQEAAKRLHLDERPELAARVSLIHSSLTYADSRLQGFEAAALVEVIEHLETEQLPRLEENLFGKAAPRSVIITTPNRDYNAVFEDDTGGMRHHDHRFEWSRAEFRAWAQAAAAQYGYAVRFEDVGEVRGEYGALTQLAEFTKIATQEARA